MRTYTTIFKNQFQLAMTLVHVLVTLYYKSYQGGKKGPLLLGGVFLVHSACTRGRPCIGRWRNAHRGSVLLADQSKGGKRGQLRQPSGHWLGRWVTVTPRVCDLSPQQPHDAAHGRHVTVETRRPLFAGTDVQPTLRYRRAVAAAALRTCCVLA